MINTRLVSARRKSEADDTSFPCQQFSSVILSWKEGGMGVWVVCKTARCHASGDFNSVSRVMINIRLVSARRKSEADDLFISLRFFSQQNSRVDIFQGGKKKGRLFLSFFDVVDWGIFPVACAVSRENCVVRGFLFYERSSSGRTSIESIPHQSDYKCSII